MTQDVASLSFNVQPGNVQQATQQLNQLGDSARHVRASTQFLVTSVSSTSSALTELASTGRASLATFLSISQHLDTVTQRMEALRVAASRLQSGFAGNTLSGSLSTMQRQFSALSQYFSMSAKALEDFNRQAQWLHMNSAQTTAAAQRIGEAMNPLTANGMAERQILREAHINMRGTPAQVLARVQHYIADMRAGPTKTIFAQSGGMGPLSAQQLERLTYEPYRTLEQRFLLERAQRYAHQSETRERNTALLNWNDTQTARRYRDLSRYVSPFMLNFHGDIPNSVYGGLPQYGAAGEARASRYILNDLRKHPFSLNDLLHLTPRGMLYDVEHNTQLGRWWQFTHGSEFTADRNEIGARYRAESEGNVRGEGFFGRVLAWPRAQLRDLKLEFGGEGAARKARIGPGGALIVGAVPRAPTLMGRLESLFEYHGLTFPKYRHPQDPFSKFTNLKAAAMMVQDNLGISGPTRVADLMVQHDNITDPLFIHRLQRLYGYDRGREIGRFAGAESAYQLHGAMRGGLIQPGFFETQPLLGQEWALGQRGASAGSTLANQGLAQNLLAYLHKQGFTAAPLLHALQGGAVSARDLLSGHYHGQYALPSALSAGFNRLMAARGAVDLGNARAANTLAMAPFPILDAYASTGGASVGFRRQQLQYYYQMRGQDLPESTARALARLHMQPQLANLGLQANVDIGNVGFASGQTMYGFHALQGAGGALVGARGLMATGERASTEEALAQAMRANYAMQYGVRGSGALRSRFVAAHQGSLAAGAMAGAQQTTAGMAQQVQDQRTMLSLLGRRGDVEAHLSDKLEAQVTYAKQLADAEASGSQKAISYVQKQIDLYTQLKDRMQEIRDMQNLAHSTEENYARGGMQAAVNKLPQGQRSLGEALMQGLAPFVNSPLVGDVPGVNKRFPTYRQPGGQSAASIPLQSYYGLPGNYRGSLPTAAQAMPSAYATHAVPGPISGAITAAAHHYNLPPVWLHAIAAAEGGGYHKVSGAGAIGPMQLMPATAAGLGVNPNDWHQNVTGGAHLFAGYLKRFNGNFAAATAAYNAGPNNPGVQAYARTGDFSALPHETQRYVVTAESQVAASGGAAPGSGPVAAAMKSTPQQVTAWAEKLGYRAQRDGKLGGWLIERAVRKLPLGPFGPYVNSILYTHHQTTVAQSRRASEQGQFAASRASAEMPYLMRGQMGAAQVAAAGQLNPVYGNTAVERAYAGAAQQQVTAENQMAFGMASGQSHNTIQANRAMTSAYNRGEAAAVQMAAKEQALAEARMHAYTPLQQLTRQQQILTQSLTETTKATASQAAQIKVQLSAEKSLTSAAQQGPMQYQVAQQNVEPGQQIRNAQAVLANPASSAAERHAAQQQIDQAHLLMQRNQQRAQEQGRLAVSQGIGQQGYALRQRQALLAGGPFQSDQQSMQSSAIASTMTDLARRGVDPNSAVGQQALAQAKQMANAQYGLSVQQQETGAFNQIPASMNSALTNAIFTFQHPSGYGLYMRYQLKNMLNSMGRSLFQASVGIPFTHLAQNGLDSLLHGIFGGGPGAVANSNFAGHGNGDRGGTGSSGAGGSGILGQLSGFAANAAWKPLNNWIQGGITNLFRSSAADYASAGSLAAMQAGKFVAPTAASGGGTLLGNFIGSLFANGGAFSGGHLVPMAVGSIVDRPTRVPMALMGEAGPEAVLPLQRDANGRLGVRVHGGSGGGGGGPTITVNAPITVGAGAAHKGQGLDQQTLHQMQQQLHQTLHHSIRQVIVAESVPGGLLSQGAKHNYGS